MKLISTIVILFLCCICLSTSLDQNRIKISDKISTGDSILLSSNYLTTILSYGDSIRFPLTIKNKSSSPQNIQFLQARLVAAPRLHLVLLSNSADETQEMERGLQALTSNFNDFDLSIINTLYADSLQKALTKADILWIPKQEDCIPTVFQGFKTVLENFVKEGGTVLFTGTSISNGVNNANCFFATELIEGELIDFLTRPSLLQASDQNQSSSFLEKITFPYTSPYTTFYYSLTDTSWQSLVAYQGYDVVAYRSLGRGKVALMGHDFGQSNTATQQLLTNVVMQARQGANNWLFFSQNKLSLAAGAIDTIDVWMKATNVFGGTYRQAISIEVQGSDCPTQALVGELEVLGEPAATIVKETIDFGPHLVGSTLFDTLLIENKGTDTLKIDRIQIDAPYFQTTTTANIIIAKAQLAIPINFTPLSIQEYKTTATIYTNAGNFTIHLLGEGIAAPTTQITPDTLSITVPVGGNTIDSICIASTNSIQLPYSLTPFLPHVSNSILYYTGGVDLLEEYQHTIDAIRLYLPDLPIIETDTQNEFELDSLLQFYPVLLVPEIEDGRFWEVFKDFEFVLHQYVERGGTLIFLGTFNGMTIKNSGFLESDFESLVVDPLAKVTFPQASHPIVAGVQDSFPTFSAMYAIKNLPDTWESLAEESTQEQTIVAQHKMEKGRVIYMACDFFSYTEGIARILTNAIELGISSPLENWISMEVIEVDTLRNEARKIPVYIDASNLLGGTYEAGVVIETGDPLHPQVYIPIILWVVGEAAISIETTSLDFGQLIINESITKTVSIQNPGTDSLFISQASSTHSDFAISPSSLTIPPRDSSQLSITFTPQQIQNYEATLIIENNVEKKSIPLLGEGLGIPELTLSVDSISLTLAAGSLDSLTLHLQNPGTGHLNWASICTTDSIDLLAWIYEVNQDNYNKTIAIIEEQMPYVNIHTTSSKKAQDLGIALMEKAILLLPSPQKHIVEEEVWKNLTPIFQAFMEQGGTIVMTGSNCDYCLEGIGLPVDTSALLSYVGQLHIEQPLHPLVHGLETIFIPTGDAFLHQFTPPNTQIYLPDDKEMYTIATQKLGFGQAIYLGFNYNSTDQNTSQALINTIQYGSRQLPPWLQISLCKGQIPPTENITLAFHFDATGLETGTYHYTLLLNTNMPNQPLLEIPIQLLVEPFPQAIFSTEKGNISCDGQVQFSNLSLHNPTNWQWDFGDGNTSTEAAPFHTYGQAGNYTVSLIACNDLGCDEQIRETFITVNYDYLYCDTIPIPQYFGDTSTNCYGVVMDSGGPNDYHNNTSPFSSQLIIQPPNASKIQLQFSEFNFESGYDFLQVYDGIGTSAPLIGQYSGQLLPNINGIIESSGGAITLLQSTDNTNGLSGFVATWTCTAPSDAPNALFDITVTNGCEGRIQFQDMSDNFPESWQWDFGDGNTSTEQFPTHQYTTNGSYDIQLTACNPLGCQSTIQSIQLDSVLQVVTIIPNDILAGKTVLFQDQTLDAVDWNWDFGNGQVVVGIQNPLMTFEETGMYLIKVEVTDINGCTGIREYEITVGSTSLTDDDAPLLLSIYPNPVDQLLHLELSDDILAWELVDVRGKVIISLQYRGNQNSIKIPTEHIQSGIYFLHLIARPNTRYSYKVMIIH